MTRRRAYYVLSSHWDREWYRPQQAFRYALVQLLDDVLAGFADGSLSGPFQTDGQAILLEDYLEVRPERRAELEALARTGKLAIGPWYTAPDEFLVGGESLVRNLRLGRRLACSFGAQPSSAGWVCDQFGHISQLPQIFAGFGLRAAFVWRGMGETAISHFNWRGADGTLLPAYRFGRYGYCSFAFQVRRSDLPATEIDAEQLWQNLEQFLAAEAARTVLPPLLLFDGGDHLAWDRRAYTVLMAYGRQADAPFELLHTSLEAYLDELLQHQDAIRHEVSGELREPAAMPRAVDEYWLIPGVLSSRVWIKQENAACESLLTQWAEPFCAWTALIGVRPYPQSMLDLAWRWLLQNHAHDSIGGCSIDLVHEDMRYRFSQCRQIADLLTTEATTSLAAMVGGELATDELQVVVFNPLPRPLNETCELTLDIPNDWPAFNEFFGFEPQPGFRIYGPDEAEIPYQRLAQTMGASRTRLDPLKFPAPYKVNAVRVSLPLNLPAMGYLALRVRPGERDPMPPHPLVAPAARPTRHPTTPGLATSECSMENEYLAVTIESNGCLSLTDKRTGARYERLLTFEDCADIGDGWYHGLALADQVVVSSVGRAGIALVHNGPQLTSFRIRTVLTLPARFDVAAMVRSDEPAELIIESLVSLRPGLDRLEVETSLCNSVADHRLRVLFASGARTDHYLSDGAFDVLERPIALHRDHYQYRELELETRPQQSWSAVYDETRGLAIISSGLLECAVRDLPERPIALTLLRSTRRTVLTDGEAGGLLLGERLRFRYWIVPLDGPPRPARLCDLGRQLAAGLRSIQLRAADLAARREPAARAGLLELAGPAVLTSLSGIEGGLEVRLFNPENTTIEAQLRLPPLCRSVTQVNLEGEALEAARPVENGSFSLIIGPKQIVSLHCFCAG